MKFFTRVCYLSVCFLPCSTFGQDIDNVETIKSTHTSLLDVFSGNVETEANQVQENKRLSVESLVTWRSEYLYRGFRVAGSSLETQLAGQFTISDTESLDFGLFYGTATGSGDFSEVAGFIDYSKDIGDYRFSGKLMFNEHNNSILRSGVSIDLGAAYQFDDKFALKSLVSYDTGARGVYAELKLEYYEEVDQDSYVILNTGISATGDYYDASGIHHLFSQLSYTYNVNEFVSFTPYVMASLAINDEIENSLLGGVYFSVSF